MKFHKQVYRHDPENGVYGDCQRTVLACLLDLSGPDAVPHFGDGGPPPGVFWDRIDGWLRQRGYARYNTFFPGEIPLRDVMRTMGCTNPGLYYMLSGKSPRGTQHVVICVGDTVLHDPHPDGGGIVAPDDTNGMWDVEVLVPLRFTEKRALRWWERPFSSLRQRAGSGLAKRRGRRWGDHDRRWGPFTYSSPDYPNIGFGVCSGRSGRQPYALLRLGTRTLVCELPAGWVKPWRRWVPESYLLGCQQTIGGYWDEHPCEYGVNVHKSGAAGGRYDFLDVSLGSQTGDSSTTRDFTCFLPWMTYRHVRDTMLAPNGMVWWNQVAEQPPVRWPWTDVRTDKRWDRWRARREVVRGQERELERQAPRVTYRFRDYDGEVMTAKCRIYESEWRRGENLFRWMGALWPPKVARRLDVEFSGETGERKGSWKGGTLASTGPTDHGDSVEAAFRAYCAEHRMEFLGAVQPAELET